MADPTLLTIDDWRAASGRDASPREPLLALQRRLEAESPPGVWISLVDRAGIESRVAALEARAARCADDVALRRTMPLFGVPFAVKDNIDVAGPADHGGVPAFALSRRDASRRRRAARSRPARSASARPTSTSSRPDWSARARRTARCPMRAFAAEYASRRLELGLGGRRRAGATCTFALGTDTAGSGRVPAGAQQHRRLEAEPRAAVSTRGVVPACRSLDCVSIFAPTVADAARVFAASARYRSARCATADACRRRARRFRVRRCASPCRAARSRVLRRRRCAAAFDAARARLQRLGGVPVPIDFAPARASADMLYEGPWVAERHAASGAFFDRTPRRLDPTVAAIIAQSSRVLGDRCIRRERTSSSDMRARRSSRCGSASTCCWCRPRRRHPATPRSRPQPVELNRRLGRYTNFVNLLELAARRRAGCHQPTRRAVRHHADRAAAGERRSRLARAAQRRFHARSRLAARRRHDADGAARARTRFVARRRRPIAVVGAHMSGPAAEHAAHRTRRAPRPRRRARRRAIGSIALPDTRRPSPGLVRVPQGGSAIELEVWEMPIAHLGSFVAPIPRAARRIGSIELADGTAVQGFLCEAHAVAGARGHHRARRMARLPRPARIRSGQHRRCARVTDAAIGLSSFNRRSVMSKRLTRRRAERRP